MKLTVLGKYGPYPAAGGGTSSYLLCGAQDAIALDFGSGALGRLQRHIDPLSLRAVVLSHLHNDHICDLLPFSYLLQARGETVELILPDTDCPQRDFLRTLDGFTLRPVQSQMQVGEFALSFEKMCHPLESYAVKACADGRTLLYSGDTSYCPQLPAFAAGSDLLLLDCGKADASSAPHLSLSEAAFLAKSLQIPAVASHINPALSYRSPSPLVTIATEGKTYFV